MGRYITAFTEASTGTVHWVWQSITFGVPWYSNYFWGLLWISLAVWALELLFPWRKDQKTFRKDFWMDGFYMFFNFFLFAIAIAGVYAIIETFFSNLGLKMNALAVVNLHSLPMWVQLLIFFMVLDFLQWVTHVALHRYPFLWQFHKVHHSVEEMGFAAHLRYHWMENILYKPLKTFGVLILGGFEPSQAFIVHFFAIIIGHLNHANIKLTWGPLKYLFNNPLMHIWHHAYDLPTDRKYGVNFGISLSLWDYLWKTNYIPFEGRDIKLGFPGVKKFPSDFVRQNLHGFKKPKQD